MMLPRPQTREHSLSLFTAGLLVLTLALAWPSSGQVSFSDVGVGLTGVTEGSAAWGDYDNDGDLDVLLTGHSDSALVSHVYRNDGGDMFMQIGAGLKGVGTSSVAWGDYDNDGDLDILLTGGVSGGRLSRVYRNDGGDVFAEVDPDLPDVSVGSVAWGDYDNDGDLDILLTGLWWTGSEHVGISRVYRNDGGDVFTDSSVGLEGVGTSSVAWGDYDSDGDLDILLTGDTGTEYVSRVYRNDGGDVFTDIGAGLTGVRSGSVAWGDYGNDGDLDILLSGFVRTDPNEWHTGVYRNDAGSFTDINAGLESVSSSSLAWGDCDNDGDLDILLTGGRAGGYYTRLYRNDAGSFTNVGAALPDVGYSSVGWGDYDNDGDLDILLTGEADSGYVASVYRSDGASVNTPPSAPGNLSATWSAAAGLMMSWDASMDPETPSDGLSYNLRVGTTPGGSEVISSMADGTSGYRRVVQLGNAQQRTSWTVTVPPGVYYWSVQAVDGAYAGSAFAAESEVRAVSFADIGAELAGVDSSSVAWGDYDNDGDLDILLTGESDSGRISRVCRNDGGDVFTEMDPGLPDVSSGSAAWGDYDNDGDLDILLTGHSDSGNISHVYRNDGGDVFMEIGAGLTGVGTSSVAWGDYDNDGDLDILLTGGVAGGRLSRVCRNEGGDVFTEIDVGLLDVSVGSVAWGDYDNDGDLDILLTGAGEDLPLFHANVCRNDGGDVFRAIGAGLTGVCYSSAAWGDYDNDGDLDILLTGMVFLIGRISCVYRNDGGDVFADISAGLTGVFNGSVAWGDCDNDGDLDILLTGTSNSGDISRVYRNDGEDSFADIGAGLEGVRTSSAAWGDYDNDGDLDLLLTGKADSGRISRIYRSDGAPANTPPATPANLTAASAPSRMTLSWDASTDPETPSAGLTYNLRVGTTPGGSEIVSAMADSTSGYRRVVQLGNAQQRRSWTVTAPPGTYYWSVQAVDGACAGSEFASESEARVIGLTDIAAGLTGVSRSSIAWGDYDDDGDLDILFTGDTGTEYVSRVYRNDAASFVDIGAGLTGVFYSSVAWGDYDNDGDLDILLTGYTGSAYISRVYRNDAGIFTDVDAGLAGVSSGSGAWGDFDNDGDFDILLTGYTGSQYVSRVYRNDGWDLFVDIDAGLAGVASSSAAWGDYDNDGDLDILLSGYTGSQEISRVYSNEAGSFTDMNAGLTGVAYSSVAWGDYDNDGDLDILLSGYAGDLVWHTGVYCNEAGSFRDIAAGLMGLSWGSVAWGDYDNDGDLDIVLTGGELSACHSLLYRNDDGIFTDVRATLPDVEYSSVAWGDYDSDGDLDLLLSGHADSGFVASVYRSDSALVNTPPVAPANLSAQVIGSRMTFSWDAATDTETPAAGLTYNLRVGTTLGGSEISSAMADSSGLRLVAALGNLNQNLSWSIELPDPPSPTYYWSVQALDACFAGSPFAPEQTLNDPATGAPALRAQPIAYALHAGAPNPFGSRTTIRFDLPRAGQTRMEIFDVTGRRVRVLVDERAEAGWYAPVWDGRDTLGRAVSSGVYFVRFQSGDYRATQKVVRTR
jgi:hypothetical protein